MTREEWMGEHMTRDQYMDSARDQINEALAKVRNRMMNLIAQAYAEGKKSAETAHMEAILREVIGRMEKPEKTETASAEPETCESWDPFIEEDGSVKMARCLSTPGLSLCNCGGDKSRCVFYGG